MAETPYVDIEQQKVSKGGASSKRGKLLYTVKTDRKRIGLEILIRVAGTAIALVSALSKGNMSLILATLVLFLIFDAWPLLHMGDSMELYENGILYVGKWYPVGPRTQVDWVGGRGFFLPTTWMGVSGCGDRINVSFMKDAEKLFNRAYNNAVYEKGDDIV
ncbi:MAG: hypothetical protein HDT33_05315 [Clostridiales bacterium]|nr:hypothetical protein [Clostridiales bacterium]